MSEFLAKLQAHVASQVHVEQDLTVRAGVMTAAGLTRAEQAKQLRQAWPQATDDDIRTAHHRLRKIAEGLKT